MGEIMDEVVDFYSTRVMKIDTPLEFENRVKEYLAWCAKHDEPILLTGLVLALGLLSKEDFYSYLENPEFSEVAQWAKLIIERSYERRLNTASATSAIFALKNLGWLDKPIAENRCLDDGELIATVRLSQGDVKRVLAKAVNKL